MNRSIGRQRLLALLVAASVSGTATPLRAQVGYPPSRSPYRDLIETQEVTIFSGYYRAKKDPARVAPQRGPMVGMLYQWRPSGPANLNFSVSRVSSERNVLDPELSNSCASGATLDCKLIGKYRWPLYLFDAGLALSLTGARSFFHVVPEVKGGLGLASDFHTQSDLGDFGFGTRFAFSWGLGMRWVPGGRYQLRADVLNHLYSLRYPESYYVAAPDKSVIFTSRQSRTAWLNNPGFTIGFSYLFSK